MKLLLDTHAFIWLVEGDQRLSVAVQAAVADPQAEVQLSIASIWEMAIKVNNGKLTLSEPIESYVDRWLNHYKSIFYWFRNRTHSPLPAFESIIAIHSIGSSLLRRSMRERSSRAAMSCFRNMQHQSFGESREYKYASGYDSHHEPSAAATAFDRCTNRHGARSRCIVVKIRQKASCLGSIQNSVPVEPRWP